MTENISVGAVGWLAVFSEYAMKVEFLGYDAYDAEYPSERTRYYRILEVDPENAKQYSWDFEPGFIHDESGRYDEVLHAERDDARAEIREYNAKKIERKERELAELRNKSR